MSDITTTPQSLNPLLYKGVFSTKWLAKNVSKYNHAHDLLHHIQFLGVGTYQGKVDNEILTATHLNLYKAGLFDIESYSIVRDKYLETLVGESIEGTLLKFVAEELPDRGENLVAQLTLFKEMLSYEINLAKSLDAFDLFEDIMMKHLNEIEEGVKLEIYDIDSSVKHTILEGLNDLKKQIGVGTDMTEPLVVVDRIKTNKDEYQAMLENIHKTTAAMLVKEGGVCEETIWIPLPKAIDSIDYENAVKYKCKVSVEQFLEAVKRKGAQREYENILVDRLFLDMATVRLERIIASKTDLGDVLVLPWNMMDTVVKETQIQRQLLMFIENKMARILKSKVNDQNFNIKPRDLAILHYVIMYDDRLYQTRIENLIEKYLAAHKVQVLSELDIKETAKLVLEAAGGLEDISSVKRIHQCLKEDEKKYEKVVEAMLEQVEKTAEKIMKADYMHDFEMNRERCFGHIEDGLIQGAVREEVNATINRGLKTKKLAFADVIESQEVTKGGAGEYTTDVMMQNSVVEGRVNDTIHAINEVREMTGLDVNVFEKKSVADIFQTLSGSGLSSIAEALDNGLLTDLTRDMVVTTDILSESQIRCMDNIAIRFIDAENDTKTIDFEYGELASITLDENVIIEDIIATTMLAGDSITLENVLANGIAWSMLRTSLENMTKEIRSSELDELHSATVLLMAFIDRFGVKVNKDEFKARFEFVNEQISKGVDAMTGQKTLDITILKTFLARGVDDFIELAEEVMGQIVEPSEAILTTVVDLFEDKMMQGSLISEQGTGDIVRSASDVTNYIVGDDLLYEGASEGYSSEAISEVMKVLKDSSVIGSKISGDNSKQTTAYSLVGNSVVKSKMSASMLEYVELERDLTKNGEIEAVLGALKASHSVGQDANENVTLTKKIRQSEFKENNLLTSATALSIKAAVDISTKVLEKHHNELLEECILKEVAFNSDDFTPAAIDHAVMYSGYKIYKQAVDEVIRRFSGQLEIDVGLTVRAHERFVQKITKGNIIQNSHEASDFIQQIVEEVLEEGSLYKRRIKPISYGSQAIRKINEESIFGEIHQVEDAESVLMIAALNGIHESMMKTIKKFEENSVTVGLPDVGKETIIGEVFGMKENSLHEYEGMVVDEINTGEKDNPFGTPILSPNSKALRVHNNNETINNADAPIGRNLVVKQIEIADQNEHGVLSNDSNTKFDYSPLEEYHAELSGSEMELHHYQDPELMGALIGRTGEPRLIYDETLDELHAGLNGSEMELHYQKEPEIQGLLVNLKTAGKDKKDFLKGFRSMDINVAEADAGMSGDRLVNHEGMLVDGINAEETDGPLDAQVLSSNFKALQVCDNNEAIKNEHAPLGKDLVLRQIEIAEQDNHKLIRNDGNNQLEHSLLEKYHAELSGSDTELHYHEEPELMGALVGPAGESRLVYEESLDELHAGLSGSETELHYQKEPEIQGLLVNMKTAGKDKIDFLKGSRFMDTNVAETDVGTSGDRLVHHEGDLINKETYSESSSNNEATDKQTEHEIAVFACNVPKLRLRRRSKLEPDKLPALPEWEWSDGEGFQCDDWLMVPLKDFNCEGADQLYDEEFQPLYPTGQLDGDGNSYILAPYTVLNEPISNGADVGGTMPMFIDPRNLYSAIKYIIGIYGTFKGRFVASDPVSVMSRVMNMLFDKISEINEAWTLESEYSPDEMWRVYRFIRWMAIGAVNKFYRLKLVNKWGDYTECFNAADKTFDIAFQTSGVAVRVAFPYGQVLDGHSMLESDKNFAEFSFKVPASTESSTISFDLGNVLGQRSKILEGQYSWREEFMTSNAELSGVGWKVDSGECVLIDPATPGVYVLSGFTVPLEAFEPIIEFKYGLQTNMDDTVLKLYRGSEAIWESNGSNDSQEIVTLQNAEPGDYHFELTFTGDENALLSPVYFPASDIQTNWKQGGYNTDWLVEGATIYEEDNTSWPAFVYNEDWKSDQNYEFKGKCMTRESGVSYPYGAEDFIGFVFNVKDENNYYAVGIWASSGNTGQEENNHCGIWKVVDGEGSPQEGIPPKWRMGNGKSRYEFDVWYDCIIRVEGNQFKINFAGMTESIEDEDGWGYGASGMIAHSNPYSTFSDISYKSAPAISTSFDYVDIYAEGYWIEPEYPKYLIDFYLDDMDIPKIKNFDSIGKSSFSFPILAGEHSAKWVFKKEGKDHARPGDYSFLDNVRVKDMVVVGVEVVEEFLGCGGHMGVKLLTEGLLRYYRRHHDGCKGRRDVWIIE